MYLKAIILNDEVGVGLYSLRDFIRQYSLNYKYARNIIIFLFKQVIFDS